MNRNTDSYFSHLPTLSFKRSRFKQQTVRRLQSQSHGTLTPFFIDIVYPGDTWSIDTNIFARADVSVKVPLDTIFTDIYYFYIPFRILDKDFEKILGGVDAYDTTQYAFPQISLEYTEEFATNDVWFTGSPAVYQSSNLWFLPFYLNYHLTAFSHIDSDENEIYHTDSIMAYGPMAYYMVYNEFFRDENVDNIIPIEDIKGNNLDLSAPVEVGTAYDPIEVVENLPLLQVNKYHDYFTSSIISPQKGPEVTLPLGLTAPLKFTDGDYLKATFNTAQGIPFNVPVFGMDYQSDDNYFLMLGDQDTEVPSVVNRQNVKGLNLAVDLSNATAASINQFAIALKLEQLYQRRAVYGTRLTEIYRGQWGLNVPDDLIDRPEYLGGCKVDMNNIPVLNTTSVSAGSMVGNSATLFNDGGFTKSFLEYGIIIGLSATRVKHMYTQGVMKRLHDLKDGIDLYNPVFANLGPQAVKLREIFNGQFDQQSGLVEDTEVFAYQEAWADLREGQSNVAGVFDPLYTGSNEFKTYWSYADYYQEAPLFSAEWLKESPANVCRTMSGTLIPGAPSVGGHQFLFDYQSHVTVYRELPARSQLSLFERY